MIAEMKSHTGFDGVCGYIFKDDAYRISGNMMARSPEELSKEFNVIRAYRREIKRPAWHIILSAPPREEPKDELWKSVANCFFEEMGFDTSDHQFYVVKHTDTDHPHIHTVANRISFSGKIFHNQLDGWKGISVCRTIEKRFGLKKTTPRQRDKERGIEREIDRFE
jgi:hypothetical protein